MRKDCSRVWLPSALTSALLVVATCSMGSERVGAGLEGALRDSGWQVERLQDGSIELRPGSASSASETQQPAEPLDAEVSEEKRADPEATEWDRLRESGWRVEEGEDGSTFLYPPVPQSVTKEKEAPEVATAQDDQNACNSEACRRAKLDAALVERGWRVGRAADGSLILYPRTAQAPSAPEPESGIQPCRGTQSTLVESAKITLPVDQWGEAKEIAKSWLESVGAEGLRVGKIRRVLRVFVVSILDSNRPYRLQHQIAINSDDGRVMVLN